MFSLEMRSFLLFYLFEPNEHWVIDIGSQLFGAGRIDLDQDLECLTKRVSVFKSFVFIRKEGNTRMLDSWYFIVKCKEPK